MSLHEYQVSQEIGRKDYPFYSLLMELMRKADDKNIEKLKREWPEVLEELCARYHAAGGELPIIWAKTASGKAMPLDTERG